MRLQGKVVAITGAGRDTGRALALAFAERGAHVFVSARDPEAARRTVDAVRASGRGGAEAFTCDLESADAVRGFAAALAERTDRLDVLVNNGARYLHGEDLSTVADEDIAGAITGAVTGTILLTKHLLPLLRASARPDIVNLVSACGEAGRLGSHRCPGAGLCALEKQFRRRIFAD